ncbi:MAG: hypothetical protein JJU34_15450 [Lunatimonas sp.]|uniref:hypothetical protein n=1 Tax=Lunatimonas sp. TaxID=2060141 RepID=UPI00263BD877|nr:hypothetical protein [Lunatimonas sp.]MCC5938676.1 hypothetical protein [Lunatimonas sp.]
MKKFILSSLAMTAILFIWSGLTQLFPWGVPSTQTISVQSEANTDGFQVSNLIEMEPSSLTTAKFDEVMRGKISTLSTDKTFSWIITAPLDNYDPMGYFIWEVITQLLVAIFLNILLRRISVFRLSEQLVIVGLAGLLAFVGIYGQMLNWWALPAIYAVGAGVNLLIGWLVAAFVSAKWIIENERTS